MKKTVINSGFTLIELLVVIGIIGILAAFAIFGIRNAFENARNTQRRSDLKQFQNALESFANRNNGLYPARYSAKGDASANPGLCSWLGLANCPRDPSYSETTGSPLYYYQTRDGAADGTASATSYILWVRLEPYTTLEYFIVCSNGKSGTSSHSPSGPPLYSSVCI